jgi:arylsulfatase A-like enzyme
VAERLNVVLVVIDGARADHFGCYGHARDTTPFLDGVAREGLRFAAAFATAPWTLPAYASLLSGLFTSTHGASDEHPSLGRRPTLLPEILQRAGYRTAAFSSNPWLSPATGCDRGFDAFLTPLGDGRSMARAAFYARRATDRLLRRSDAGARRTNLAFFDWVGTGEQPFFCLLHYGEARLKRQPPAPYERLFLGPEVRGADLKAAEREWNRAGAPHEAEAEGLRRVLAGLYDGALRYVDARLQEVARHLESIRQWDRTLFIVTGDHGQDLGEHAMVRQGFGLYDTLLRVPLLLRCPPCVPQGFAVDEFAQHVDVLPTVLESLGLASGQPVVHGRPLLRDGRTTAGPEFAVAERFRPDLAVLRKQLPGVDVRRFDVRERALRTRREKFIWRSDEDNEFYDLIADPGERENRIVEAARRGSALRARLFDWLASVEHYAPDEAVAADETERQQA